MIADHLKFDTSTISCDVAVIRQQSKERLITHLEERLPLEYDVCLGVLKDVRRRAYEIVEKKETDDKTRLAAIAIVKDSTKDYVDILTHSETVKTAMSWSTRANKELAALDNNNKDKGDNEQSSDVVDNTSNDTSRPAENTSGESTTATTATAASVTDRQA